LKHKAVDRTVWRTGCGRSCGPVVRQAVELLLILLLLLLNFYHLYARYLQLYATVYYIYVGECGC
jgi:hypothetical protein